MTEISLPGRSVDRNVVVIGAAGIDMVGMLNAPAEPGSVNEASIRASFGGVGRNVAENLARLGQAVSLITAVGQDQVGGQLLVHTAECGVDVSHCLQSEKYSTGSYLAIYNADGTRHLTLEDMKIVEDLTPAFLRKRRENIVSAGLVFTDANLPSASLKALMQIARKAEVPVCVDSTSSLLVDRLLPYLDKIAMLTANRGEASALCKGEAPVVDEASAMQAARSLVNQGVKLAVITLAELGVVYATSQTSGHVPAVYTPVVDPTGAGDALTATIIFGLINDIPIDESVRLGVTAASLILRHRGTVLPGLSLEKLYDELVV